MKYVIGALIVASAVMTAGVITGCSQISQTATKRESAYDRVMRTGVLRCAYGLWDPCVMRDPNTGKFSGIIYDFMQDLGKSINVKIDYCLEVPWDSIGSTLQCGKADAHCAGIWATPARGRVMAFSHPLFFSPTVVFARADDKRFDFNIGRINQPDVTVAISDDDITTEIYNNEFPRAKKYQLPQFAPAEELLLAVATKKADVAFNSPPRLHSFEKGYPGLVKIVPAEKPLRIYPDTIAVDIHEEELLQVLNTAIDRLRDSGEIDKLASKYRAKYDMDFLVPVNPQYTWKVKSDKK
jgi:polar amino acid transport system substrate-binding protein